jgi:hypothetical protein
MAMQSTGGALTVNGVPHAECPVLRRRGCITAIWSPCQTRDLPSVPLRHACLLRQKVRPPHPVVLSSDKFLREHSRRPPRKFRESEGSGQLSFRENGQNRMFSPKFIHFSPKVSVFGGFAFKSFGSFARTAPALIGKIRLFSFSSRTEGR